MAFTFTNKLVHKSGASGEFSSTLNVFPFTKKYDKNFTESWGYKRGNTAGELVLSIDWTLTKYRFVWKDEPKKYKTSGKPTQLQV